MVFRGHLQELDLEIRWVGDPRIGNVENDISPGGEFLNPFIRRKRVKLGDT